MPWMLVSRQAPDDECSQRHDHHCDHQHDLAADPIAEMTEDSTADRTRDEPYRIGCQRSQGAGQGIDVWKKQGVKDERRRGAVDQEIIPFDDGAD
jgi:hypothetical protein